MEEIFGLSMNVLMVVVLAVFLAAMAVLAALAWRNRIMLKLGLRPIPRRLGQTVLIIVGVMLSTVIISAAFGTGDTLSFSIRSEVLEELKTIDEIIIPARAKADDSFGSAPYVPYQRFAELQAELADFDEIDGLAPQIGESVPAVNLRTSQSEGSMRVAGVAPDLLEGFGTFKLTSGEDARLDDLLEDEAYINDKAAEELDAVAGDELRLFIEGQPPTFKVKGVVERGGLAGRDSTLILPLARAQEIFGRVGEINSILVSNRGDVREGAELSKQVARKLRVLYTDRVVASQVKGLLNEEEVLKALEDREESLAEHMQKDVSKLRKELQRAELSDELISLLADRDVVDVVFDVLEKNELREVEREARTLFADLVEFRVFEVKRRLLDLADDVGSGVTTFFMVFSLFSIAVGILLIFLIFVMLASARRSEMGMARAVGAKRRHLVQMFTFEGTAYSLVSAAVGVVLGLAISAGMIVIINWLIASFEDDSFRLSIHFEPRTIIVSYCVGMIITFATVAVSSYRVSRLNIVTAVRGLPEAIVLKSRSPLLTTPAPGGESPGATLRLLVAGDQVLVETEDQERHCSTWASRLCGPSLRSGLSGIAVALLRFSWPYFLRGWLLLLLGALVTWWGISGLERLSVFTGGVSLMILGFGLMLRVLAVRQPNAARGVRRADTAGWGRASGYRNRRNQCANHHNSDNLGSRRGFHGGAVGGGRGRRPPRCDRPIGLHLYRGRNARLLGNARGRLPRCHQRPPGRLRHDVRLRDLHGGGGGVDGDVQRRPAAQGFDLCHGALWQAPPRYCNGRGLSHEQQVPHRPDPGHVLPGHLHSHGDVGPLRDLRHPVRRCGDGHGRMAHRRPREPKDSHRGHTAQHR